jgi:hypothetical protein
VLRQRRSCERSRREAALPSICPRQPLEESASPTAVARQPIVEVSLIGNGDDPRHRLDLYRDVSWIHGVPFARDSRRSIAPRRLGQEGGAPVDRLRKSDELTTGWPTGRESARTSGCRLPAGSPTPGCRRAPRPGRRAHAVRCPARPPRRRRRLRLPPTACRRAGSPAR